MEEHFDFIKAFTTGAFTEIGERAILAQGELLSTALFTLLMKEEGFNAILLPALDFMKIDADKTARNSRFIKQKINEIIAARPCADYYTQGFICRNELGEIDNLQRGGSDYTATLIGAAINNSEVKSGPTSTDSTTMIRDLSKTPNVLMSSHSMKQPSWPILEQRSCIPKPYCRQRTTTSRYV